MATRKRLLRPEGIAEESAGAGRHCCNHEARAPSETAIVALETTAAGPK